MPTSRTPKADIPDIRPINRAGIEWSRTAMAKLRIAVMQINRGHFVETATSSETIRYLDRRG